MPSDNPFATRQRFGSQLGLERITQLCCALENPQHQFRSIHIAGTNGKGSVAAMLRSILSEAGYKTGLYTSPHLVEYSERFQVDGVQIISTRLQSLAQQVELACKQIEANHPELGVYTEFEVATALGFLHFAHEQVDVAIIEVGLGGRLDATNVIIPEVSVITPIGHDHMEWLGNTLPQVAKEKAGIIKSGRPVVSGMQQCEVDAVLYQVAQEQGSVLYQLSQTQWAPGLWGLHGGEVCFPSLSDQPFSFSLLGAHQCDNAGLVLLTVEQLLVLGWDISVENIREGLNKTSWPGRLELIRQDPVVILDGAHNQEGFDALARSLKSFRPGKKQVTFLIGMLENKESSLIKPLLPLAKRIVFSQITTGRIPPKDPHILQAYAQTQGVDAQVVPVLAEAIKTVEQDEFACICGSLYLIGGVKAHLLGKNRGNC